MKINKLILIGFIFLLGSCDPGVQYDKIIENNTSYDIWLIKSNTDSTIILSNTIHVISMDIDIGGALDQYESCPLYPEFNDTIRTRIDGNDTLNLSEFITGNSNWQFKITDSRGGSKSAECRLIITDSDIE